MSAKARVLVAEKWPAAYALLKRFEMNAEEEQKMTYRIHKKGEKLDAVVKEWIEANEAVWKPWMDAAGS